MTREQARKLAATIFTLPWIHIPKDTLPGFVEQWTALRLYGTGGGELGADILPAATADALKYLTEYRDGETLLSRAKHVDVCRVIEALGRSAPSGTAG